MEFVSVTELSYYWKTGRIISNHLVREITSENLIIIMENT